MWVDGFFFLIVPTTQRKERALQATVSASVRMVARWLAAAVQEALYLTQLLKDMDPSSLQTTAKVFEDNLGTVCLARKHVDKKYHFIKVKSLAG